jgi:hypothetical protein
MSTYNLIQGKAKTLEDAFFLNEDLRLRERLAEMKKMAETKENLAKVSGLTNDAVLSKLVELNVHPETLASLAAIPLVEVAWADGEVSGDERAHILASISKDGFAGESNGELVNAWLSNRPKPELFLAWSHYMEGLCEQLSPAERDALKTEILAHADAVARASGGFLGIGKVSKAERDVLDRIAASFTRPA